MSHEARSVVPRQLGRIFRNEGISTRHNPEFTSIELYPAYCDYTAMMELTEELIVGAAAEIGKGSVLENQGQQVDLTTPWRRASMHELVQPLSRLAPLSLHLSPLQTLPRPSHPSHTPHTPPHHTPHTPPLGSAAHMLH